MEHFSALTPRDCQQDGGGGRLFKGAARTFPATGSGPLRGRQIFARLCDHIPLRVMQEVGVSMAVRLVLTTCPNETGAADIARTLVERRLAACATRLHGAVSVYRWRESIEETDEVQLLIKTSAERVPTLMEALADLHPYEEPEMLVIDVTGGSPGYLAWIEAMTGEAK